MSRTIGYSGSYGWAGQNPTKLRNTLIRANDAFETLRKTVKFDAIAFCGSSGAAFAFPLAVSHKIPLIYVRKTGEQSHGNPVECNGEGRIKKYLIVDDFIASGATVEWIAAQVKKYSKGDVKPAVVGVFCFEDTDQNAFKRDFGFGPIQIYTPKWIFKK